MIYFGSSVFYDSKSLGSVEKLKGDSKCHEQFTAVYLSRHIFKEPSATKGIHNDTLIYFITMSGKVTNWESKMLHLNEVEG